MKVATIAAVILCATAAVVAGVVVVDGPSRPPLTLPAASAFPSGPCRDAAEAVLSLGRFTYEHVGAESLPATAYPFLKEQAQRLASVRNTAIPDEAAGPGAAPATSAPPAANADPTSNASPAPSAPNEAANTVKQALSVRFDAVLAAIGFVRLRPGQAYDPDLLRNLEAARADLQKTCLGQA